MSLSLAHLLAGAGADVPASIPPVTGINANSQAIGAGEAFFALPGTITHGNSFVANAVDKGASVVVSDKMPAAEVGVPVILVQDVRAAYAMAAARSFQPQPGTAVAVTGTNGKTSVASFIRQIWAANGVPAASIGTIGIETGAGLREGSLTTPDALTLHRTLAELKAEGIDYVALEASSHGLDQRRLDGLRFKVAGFTNLTRDHLDYHEDMESYAAAKLRLFNTLLAPDGAAVVNVDDPEHTPFLFAALDKGVPLLTVGREGAYFEISSIRNQGFGQRVTGRLVGEEVEFVLPLTGAFQVSNAVVALAMALASGMAPKKSIAALGKLRGARGRLELVAQRDGGAVFVDYAHTPDALKNALEALRPYARGKLSVVFGCGGDRDKGKRAVMGAIATELADRVVVTDDNPRTEASASIRADILSAAPGAEDIGNRTLAIRRTIAGMGTNDVVLVAGKGHEDYQIVGITRHRFSDHAVIAKALKDL